MIAYCGRPSSASFCDRFPYIVHAMRGKRSQKAARAGSPSLRRSLLRQAPSYTAVPKLPRVTSMTTLIYHIVNVFTRGDDRFSGNPLCVFQSGASLDAATMQALALQFNLSE